MVLLGIMTGAVSLEDDTENEWARISRNEAHIDRGCVDFQGKGRENYKRTVFLPFIFN